MRAETGASFQIQRLRRNDQPEVRRLILDGLEDHWGVLDPHFNRDLDDIATSYAEGTVIVARDAGRIVGAGVIVPADPGTGEVKRVSVARDARRRGVGTAVMSELVAEAGRRGWTRVVLETSADWDDAVRFYGALGFRLTHHEDGAFGRDAFFALDVPRTRDGQAGIEKR